MFASQMVTVVKAGQIEARSQEILQDSLTEDRDPKHLDHLSLFIPDHYEGAELEMEQLRH